LVLEWFEPFAIILLWLPPMAESKPLDREELERGVAALRQAVTLTPAVGDPGKEQAFNRLGQILEASGDRAGARAAAPRSSGAASGARRARTAAGQP
jgi:hypothetical protein